MGVSILVDFYKTSFSCRDGLYVWHFFRLRFLLFCSTSSFEKTLDFYSLSNYSCAELRRLYYFSTNLSRGLTKQWHSGCSTSRVSDMRIPENRFFIVSPSLRGNQQAPLYHLRPRNTRIVCFSLGTLAQYGHWEKHRGPRKQV